MILARTIATAMAFFESSASFCSVYVWMFCDKAKSAS
jgi:hypothetical protein